jgi:hypothetical protein
MKPEHLIFLAPESIPFGSAIDTPRPLVRAPRRIAARLRDTVILGGLACLVWVAVAYVASL